MIIRKTPEEIEKIAAAGEIHRRTMRLIEGKIRPGVTTKQLDEAETRAAVEEVMREIECGGLKDMGRVMGVLKERYSGRMDFAKASSIVKELLK